MKKPIKPNAPTEPRKPLEFFDYSETIYCGISDGTLKDVKESLEAQSGVSINYNDIKYECDYGGGANLYIVVPRGKKVNATYNQQMKVYERELKKYKEKMEIYKVKKKDYDEKMKLYEKEIEKREIESAKKVLKKYGVEKI